MAYDQERGAAPAGADPATASGGKAAGKRALTDRLAQRAAQKNPVQQAKLGFKRDAFSSAAVDSQEFAHDVADKQAAHGLKVDGVAGRKTVKAVTGLDPFDYLDTGPKKGDGKGGKGKAGRGKAADAKSTQLLTGCSHKDELDRGSRLVATFGLEDGISPFTTFQVTDEAGHPIPGCEVSLLAIHGATTELRCTRPLTVLPPEVSILATIPAPPELEHHGDGSIGDDHDDRLEA